MAARLLGIGLLLAGIITCCVSVKYDRSRRLSSAALALVLATLIGAIILNWIEAIQVTGVKQQILLSTLLLVPLISSAGLAILALVFHGATKRDARAPAVWALIICLTSTGFLARAFQGKLDQLRAPSEPLVKTSTKSNNTQPFPLKPVGKNSGETKTFDDLNFRLTPPGSPWVEVSPETLNDDATLAYLRSPGVYFTVIAEKLGDSYDSESLNEFVRAHILSNSSSAKISDSHETRIDGLPGVKVESESTYFFGAVDAFHDLRTIVHNGYGYQLVTWGDVASKREVIRWANAFAEGFEILDHEKVFSESGTPVEDFHSDSLGITTNLSEKGWTAWEGFQNDQPGKAVGALHGSEALFTADAIPIQGLNPDRDTLVAGLLSTHYFDWPDETISIVPVEVKGAKSAWDLRAEYEFDDGNYKYQMRIIRGDSTAYLLCGWHHEDMKNGDGIIRDAIESTVTFDPSQEDKPTQLQKQARADVFRSMGFATLGTNQFEEAIKYFEASHNANPDDLTSLASIGRATYDSGEYEMGLKLIDSLSGESSTDPQVRFYKALLNWENGDTEKAIDLYVSVFSSGYDDSDHLLDCLNQFVDADRASEAIPIIDLYLSHNPQTYVRRWKAQLYTRAGNYDPAIEVLKKILEDAPGDVQSLYTLGETCNDASKYVVAEEVAEELLQKGFDNSRTTSIKGWSEYYRELYVQAHETFSDGLKKEPENLELQNALRIAASALGKGDNFTVSTPLPPVPIPESVTGKLTDLERMEPTPASSVEYAGDFGAYFNFVVTGIHYKKGELQRKTVRASVKVVERSGVNRFSTLEVSFNPLFERIFVNELKVYDEEGELIGKGALDDFFVTDATDDPEADHDQVLHIPVPGLRPGATLEYTLTRESIGTLDEPEFRHNIFSSGLPQKFKCIYLTGDTSQIRHSHSPDIQFEQEENLLVWSMANVPFYRWEPLEPASSGFLPEVYLGPAQRTWDEIGAEYLQQMGDRLDVGSDIKELAGKLTRDKADAASKISILSRYVRDELEYKAIEFGVRGRTPNRVGQIISDKYGDCKDHSLLLYQLLNAVDIPARLALVSTDTDVREALPTLDQFNHMIVFVQDEGSGSGAFIDCTDEHASSTPSIPPPILAGRPAFVLRPDGGSSLVPIGKAPGGTERLTSEREITIMNESDAVVSETVSIYGYTGSYMREYLASIDRSRRDDGIISQIASDQHLEIEDLEVSNLADPDKPLQLKLRYRLEGVVAKRRGQLIGTIPCLWERFYLNPTHVKSRRNPFEIEQDFSVESSILLVLDRPVTKGMLEGLQSSHRGEICSWNVRATDGKNNNSIQISASVTTSPGKHPPELYPTYERERRSAVRALTLWVDTRD